jgi:hypothetical protein
MNSRISVAVICALISMGCGSSRAGQPNPHPADWTQAHPAAFIASPSSCVACHGSTSDPAASGGTSGTSCFSCHNHSANAPCANCHINEQFLWASSSDLHAATAAAVLTNPDHNSTELLIDDCLKCHASFQVPLGVAHFVTPVDTTGLPAGTWTALNGGAWQATRCEVCHDPTSTNTMKLAKYGSVLDGTWSAGYTPISGLAAAYQTVISPSTGAVSTFTFADQTTLEAQATKLCNSCHDPADQGGDPDITLGGIDYGPQGGDSRAYVTTSHQGLGCTSCHPTHDFTPVNPAATTTCGSAGCHATNRAGALPGKVHVNHL